MGADPTWEIAGWGRKKASRARRVRHASGTAAILWSESADRHRVWPALKREVPPAFRLNDMINYSEEPNTQHTVVALEGNVGVGKTTWMAKLKADYESACDDPPWEGLDMPPCVFFDEELRLLLAEDKRGQSLLSLAASEDKRKRRALEIAATASSVLRDMSAKGAADVALAERRVDPTSEAVCIFLDRSTLAGLVWSEDKWLGVDKPTQQTTKDYFYTQNQLASRGLTIDKHLIMECKPETALARIKKRGRPDESHYDLELVKKTGGHLDRVKAVTDNWVSVPAEDGDQLPSLRDILDLHVGSPKRYETHNRLVIGVSGPGVKYFLRGVRKTDKTQRGIYYTIAQPGHQSAFLINGSHHEAFNLKTKHYAYRRALEACRRPLYRYQWARKPVHVKSMDGGGAADYECDILVKLRSPHGDYSTEGHDACHRWEHATARTNRNKNVPVFTINTHTMCADEFYALVVKNIEDNGWQELLPMCNDYPSLTSSVASVWDKATGDPVQFIADIPLSGV